MPWCIKQSNVKVCPASNSGPDITWAATSLPGALLIGVSHQPNLGLPVVSMRSSDTIQSRGCEESTNSVPAVGRIVIWMKAADTGCPAIPIELPPSPLGASSCRRQHKAQGLYMGHTSKLSLPA